MRGEESSCAVTPPPQFKLQSLTSDNLRQGDIYPRLRCRQYCPKMGLQTSAIPAKSKNPLFPQRCQGQFWIFGFMDLWGFGIVDSNRKLQKPKSPKIQNWLWHLRLDFGFLDLRWILLSVAAHASHAAPLAHRGWHKVFRSRAHYEGTVVYARLCPICSS